MAPQQQLAENSETAEPRLADIVGDMRLPKIGGKMIRTLIELPDGQGFVWLRVSRRINGE